MQKKEYITPSVIIVETMIEGLLQALTGTKTETPNGGESSGPSNGGIGDGSDADAKKHNAWSSWDE